jgi:hypothetical protein
VEIVNKLPSSLRDLAGEEVREREAAATNPVICIVEGGVEALPFKFICTDKTS